MVSLLWINRANLSQAALAYAMKGWPVILLEPKGKRPLTDKTLPAPEGDEGLIHGLKDATTDLELITQWWGKYPDANIGLRTGLVFDVLDLDGPEAVGALMKRNPKYRHHGPLSSTGKGYHLFYAVTGSKNHAGMLESTIDFRGDNGYVVASPSIHPNGHKYVWVRDDSELAPPPEWMLPYLFPPKIERKTDPNDPAVKKALQESGDVVEVFGIISRGEMERIGDRYVLYCPFHKDDTASLVLYIDTNSFYCFGCGAWGDPLNVRRWLKTGRLRRGEKKVMVPEYLRGV